MITLLAKQNVQQTLNLILDTGACANMLSMHVAEKLNVHVNRQDTNTFEGIGRGIVRTLGTVILDLLVGNFLIPAEFHLMNGLPADGIIGVEFLKKHTLQIGNNFDYIVFKKHGNRGPDSLGPWSVPREEALSRHVFLAARNRVMVQSQLRNNIVNENATA